MNDLAMLEKFLLARIEELGRRIESKDFETQRALIKADAATDKRFEGVNEFRAALSDQTATFVTRSEYSSKHEALAEKMDSLGTRVTAMEAVKTGVGLSAGVVAQILTTLLSFTGVVVAILLVLKR